MNKNSQNKKALFKIRKFKIFTFPVEHLNHGGIRKKYMIPLRNHSNFLDYF